MLGVSLVDAQGPEANRTAAMTDLNRVESIPRE